MARKARKYDGTEIAAGGVTYTLHDDHGCTLVRMGGTGGVVGWWVRTDDRARLGTAAFVHLPDHRGGDRRVGMFRSAPKMVAALHRARLEGGAVCVAGPPTVLAGTRHDAFTAALAAAIG